MGFSVILREGPVCLNLAIPPGLLAPLSERLAPIGTFVPPNPSNVVNRSRSTLMSAALSWARCRAEGGQERLVIDQVVAFAAVQPPPFSSIDQPHPSPDGDSLSLSLSFSLRVYESLRAPLARRGWASGSWP